MDFSKRFKTLIPVPLAANGRNAEDFFYQEPPPPQIKVLVAFDRMEPSTIKVKGKGKGVPVLN
jgi:hypothetical protein